MRKHVKAFTYEPKIEDVRAGNIRQTIRPGNGVSEGDEILYHGWSGKPYRSPWSWRLRVEVVQVLKLVAFMDCFYLNGQRIDWSSRAASLLAKLDGIKPVDDMNHGETLRWLLDCWYDLPGEWEGGGVQLQVIRHGWPPLEGSA